MPFPLYWFHSILLRSIDPLQSHRDLFPCCSYTGLSTMLIIKPRPSCNTRLQRWRNWYWSNQMSQPCPTHNPQTPTNLHTYAHTHNSHTYERLHTHTHTHTHTPTSTSTYYRSMLYNQSQKESCETVTCWTVDKASYTPHLLYVAAMSHPVINQSFTITFTS